MGGPSPVEAQVVESSSSGRYHDEETTESSRGSVQSPSNELISEEHNRPWYRRPSSHVPPRIRRIWRVIVIWVKGPDPPRPYTIKPLFPRIQHAPLKLLDRTAPKTKQKFWLLIALYAAWLLTFGLVLWASNAAAEVPGYGSPVVLSCAASFWSDDAGCGLNGDQCRPFSNSTLAFRCPADCAKVQVLNPHAVGDQEVVYQSLTVGGPVGYQTGYEGVIENNAVYRGDSFICAAAVHSGFIYNSQGGCGVTTLTGQQPSFVASQANGIQSIGFDSYFPQTFGFRSGTLTQCKDMRWTVLLVSTIFSVILSVFTTSPGVFFWSTFVNMFFTVALASDPPFADTFYGLFSTAVGRFLPAAFCIGVMNYFFIQRSLTGLTAQVEKTILWIGAAWVGALNNYTFDKIPIQRLTPHDIKAQPGAIPALIIIILVLIFIAFGQAWAFRVEGRMPQYLLLYGIMAAGLLILLALPGEDLRIHHYILALLFIPGTSFQNRLSLLYQGLLVGLFINGIARWGFDSIIQTPDAILSGVATDSLLPAISVLNSSISNITFNLGQLPVYDSSLDSTYEGISILVNDVERFRAYGDGRDTWDTEEFSQVDGNLTWTWHRLGNDNTTYPEYFRFGYLFGSTSMDYTKAGRWDQEGKWKQMESGPS